MFVTNIKEIDEINSNRPKNEVDIGDTYSLNQININVSRVFTQELVEKMYNRKQQRNLLRKCFQSIIEPIKDKIADENIVLDVLGILALRKEMYVTSLVEILITKHDIDKSAIDIAQNIMTAGLFGLINLNIVNNNVKVYAKYSLNQQAYNILEQYQYLLPMIVEPLPVGEYKTNKGSGYLTIRNDSLILNNNHHKGDLCTEVLDLMNETPLSLNISLIKTVRNNWKNLDKQQEGETEEEYQERVKAFETYERLFMNAAAFLIHQGNEFYLTHKYDKRGRLYACGYQLNTQGNSFQKAVIELRNRETISDIIDFFKN